MFESKTTALYKHTSCLTQVCFGPQMTCAARRLLAGTMHFSQWTNMEHRNLDFGIPLTREQWEQLGQSANFRPDFGVMRWSPADPDVIQVSIREEELPEGWDVVAPPDDGRRPDDREVARFVYNDGRPFARLEPPAEPKPPAITAERDRELGIALERWVRAKWHELLRDSGIHYDRGSLPAEEPNPPR